MFCEGTYGGVILTIPGALPKKDDDHLCSAFQIQDWFGKDTVYINEFQVKPSTKNAHHMLIYACNSPLSDQGNIWYYVKSLLDLRAFKVSQKFVTINVICFVTGIVIITGYVRERVDLFSHGPEMDLQQRFLMA